MSDIPDSLIVREAVCPACKTMHDVDETGIFMPHMRRYRGTTVRCYGTGKKAQSIDIRTRQLDLTVKPVRFFSLLFLFILVCAGVRTFAHESHDIENWVDVSLVCTNGEQTLLHVDAAPDVLEVLMYDTSNVHPYAMFIDMRGDERTGVWVDADSGIIEVEVYLTTYNSQGYHVATIDISQAHECGEPREDPAPIMNECLGIDPRAYGLPIEGVFTVDGFDYTYNQNISFTVATMIEWRWDLYVEGNYILSFEQSEGQACHIIGSS